MNSTETRKFKQVYAQFQRLLTLQGYTDAAIRAIPRLSEWCGNRRRNFNI